MCFLFLERFQQLQDSLSTMKNFFRSPLILLSFTAMVSVTGCGDSQQSNSMTEGVELSEIEAYEQSVRQMESEDEGAMDNVAESP